MLFHASQSDDIEELVPRRISTPAIEQEQSPARVYASDYPAYAAAHGFSWATDEGFYLTIEHDEGGEERVKFRVPRHLAHRLDQSVCVYGLSPDSFDALKHVDPPGRNFASLNAVKPVARRKFPSVRAAIEFYGGVIELYATR